MALVRSLVVVVKQIRVKLVLYFTFQYEHRIRLQNKTFGLHESLPPFSWGKLRPESYFLVLNLVLKGSIRPWRMFRRCVSSKHQNFSAPCEPLPLQVSLTSVKARHFSSVQLNPQATSKSAILFAWPLHPNLLRPFRLPPVMLSACITSHPQQDAAQKIRGPVKWGFPFRLFYIVVVTMPPHRTSLSCSVGNPRESRHNRFIPFDIHFA